MNELGNVKNGCSILVLVEILTSVKVKANAYFRGVFTSRCLESSVVLYYV